MPRLIALILAVLGIVGGALLWLSREDEPSALPTAPADKEVAFDSREWIEALRNGGEIEFVRESATPGVPPATAFVVESLGPIANDRVDALIESLGVEPSAVALAEAATKAERGAPEDFVAFLNERYCYEKVRLAADKARRGDYITLAMGNPLPRPPDDYVFLGQIGVSYVGDKRVDVWFPFDLSQEEYRELRQMKADWEEADALLMDEEVYEFNLLPLDERKRRIDAHLAATRELRSVAPGSMTTGQQQALRANLLPVRFVVDSNRSIVSRRIIHHY